MRPGPLVFVWLLGPVWAAADPTPPGTAGRGSSPALPARTGEVQEIAAVPSAGVPEAPIIEWIRVERGGGKARLSVTFSAVPGATSYNLQVSKALTFPRLVLDITELEGPLRDLNLTPGVYFLRLRAFHGERPGPFSKVEVVNAMVAGDRVLRQARETPAPAAGTGGTPQSVPAGSAGVVASAVAPPPPPPPPPPAPPPLPSNAPASTVPATAGPVSSSSSTLRPLPPALLLSEAELVRLGPLRPRYEALLAELRDLEALRQALEANAATLVQRLAGTQDARASAELLDELTSLQSAHRALDAEVERMFREIASLQP